MPETTQLSDKNKNTGPEGSLKANTILLTRYKILGVLGGGGMGTVYQARDLNFPDVRRLVAIKEMHNPATDRALRDSALKTFRREANILATLSHPAIPKIFDFFDRDDRAYLVQEYINGSDLELLISKTKGLPVDKIAEWCIDLCEVLEYLHTHQPEQIIFRDIKPSNIMVDSLGKVRLIDFGIAKALINAVTEGGAKKHTMIGTEGYSAPEQYKGDISPRSDIYSLGATLHHVLTRKDPRLEPPFSFHERPIADYNPEVPDGFIKIINKALAFNQEDRWESCGEMREALLALRYQPVNVGSAPVATPSTMPTHSDAGGAVAQPGAVNGGEQTEFFEGEGAAGGLIDPKWVFATEDEVRSGPSASKSHVFVGSYDSNVYCVTQDTGDFVWKHATQGGIASSATYDRSTGLVFFGSEDFTFNAIDASTGKVAWSFQTKGKVRGTPNVALDHVFFGSDDGFLYALSAANGRKLWEYNSESPVRTRPAVNDELVVFGNDLGEVMAIPLSGAEDGYKWIYRTRRSINSSPAMDEETNMVYLGSHDYNLYALDAASGYSSWKFRTQGPVISSPVMFEDLVLFGSADGYFYAVNTETSREKWKYAVGKPIVGSPVVHNGAVYFGGTDNVLYCIDIKKGKERWQYTAGGAITSAPVITQDTIVFGSLDKKLYALPLVE